MSTGEEKPCWLDHTDPRNPFAFEVVDCRSIALNMVSTTTDPQVVADFFGLRGTQASEVAAMRPIHPIPVECRFVIAYDKPLTDGPLFVAPAMEHKWDIHTYAGRLYARRSWTGHVIHVAGFEKTACGELAVHSLEYDSNSVVDAPEFAVAQLHFLLSTYLERRLRAFPIPPSQRQDDATDIALAGWSYYGRVAQFACRLSAYATLMSKA